MIVTNRHTDRQYNRHLLAVPRFRLNTYGRRAFSVAGPMAWNSLPRILSGIQRAARTVLGVYLKRTCSRVTSASSALGVLDDYALYKSTHSRTHTLIHRPRYVGTTAATVRTVFYAAREEIRQFLTLLLLLLLRRR